MRKFQVVIFLTVQALLCVSIAFSEEAAPYTKEAYDKINMAIRKVPQLPYKDNTYTEDRAYRLLEKQREIYNVAGYSYDATLKKVANDLQKSNNPIPEGTVTVAGIIVAGVHIMMSECENQKVDCLRRYPPDLAQAIRSIRNNSKFSL